MPQAITATLYVDETANPPNVRVVVQVGSHTVADRVLEPLEAVRAIGVVAADAPEATQAIQTLVATLAQRVQNGAADQAAREAALQAWQDALAVVPEIP